jgi:outer membrane protein assembly factor BamC
MHCATPACFDARLPLIPSNPGSRNRRECAGRDPMEMQLVIRFRSPPLKLSASLMLVASITGCSSIETFVAGDKVDYRSAGTKTQGLEVPPDLTQLARDTRYQSQGGTVSAAAFQAATPASGTAATLAAATVAPKAIGELRIERQGNQRWLSTPLTPEQLWPQLQAYWKDRGFTLVLDQPASGVMETDWAENRAKLPNDVIRNAIGKVLDSLYSTSERDKFRTRVERSASGSGTEVYISHRGLIEVYSSERKDATVWQARPADPQLEGEFLSGLMVRLGVKEEQAKSAVAGAPVPAARARLLEGRAAATLQVDDAFDRAWRRVGLALDRSGFTVEDRDRAQGLYFVRYVESANPAKEEPGFLAKLFTFGKKDEVGNPTRYRVSVKGEGEGSSVSVLDAQGAPENGAAGRRIVSLLVEDLK